jgi:putative hydrolase
MPARVRWSEGAIVSEESEPWMRLLRELFGEEAEAALEQLRAMGMDPAALAQASGVADSPGMVDHLLGQIRALVKQSQGEDVNWTLAHDVARGVAAQGGDPTVTAAVAGRHRAAVTSAELWLDAATDFNPSTLEPRIWSRAEWVEATLPTWRYLAGPVAASVSAALTSLLREERGEERSAGEAGALLGAVSPTVCGMHMGEAAGTLAREAFGSTDLGFPLLHESRVVLVPRSIEDFAAGLDIDRDKVLTYLALREAAHVRLFGAAPWLAGQLRTTIERYAASVTIDAEALDDAVRSAGMGDPQKLQQALGTGIFASAHSEEQRATLVAIETWLALIEGWVDEVTTRAAAPHVPELGQLREMMRRRRAAGGPAEDTFAKLMGLELRPRRLRDASAMWAELTLRLGPQKRDDLWSHPDVLPTAAELESWDEWIERVTGHSEPDDIDKELARMLEEGGEPPVAGKDSSEA